VAGVAAVASYAHTRDLAERAGEGWLSWLLPLAVDGLVVAASMTMVARRRTGRSAGALSWVSLLAGLGASLGANVAAAEPTLIGRAVSAWPPVALLLAYELLMQQGRHGQEPAGKPPADVPATADRQVSGTSAVLPVAAAPDDAPAEAVLERLRQEDSARALPLLPAAAEPALPSAAPATPPSVVPVVPGPVAPSAAPEPVRCAAVPMTAPRAPYPSLDDDRRRARARYRQAAAAGERLTGERLGAAFGRSERWGRDQIAAVRQEDAHPPKVPSSVH
jgi:hypothetical protein